jgi:hypothetical protein
VDEDQEDGKRERVNIKVPLKLLRAGISIGGLMPKDAKAKINEALKAKGIEVDPFSLEGSDADGIIEALSDLEINADDSGKKIRIHVAYDENDGDHDDEGDAPSEPDDVGQDFDVNVVRKVKKGLKKTLKKNFQTSNRPACPAGSGPSIHQRRGPAGNQRQQHGQDAIGSGLVMSIVIHSPPQPGLSYK